MELIIGELNMYKIIYEDNTIFKGNNLQNSKWNEIDKPIKSIHYNLINQICMQGYEHYNHLIERANLSTGQCFFTKVLLLGKKGKRVDIIEIDLRKKETKSYKTEFGKEYNNNYTTGWKTGLQNQICGFEITKKVD